MWGEGLTGELMMLLMGGRVGLVMHMVAAAGIAGILYLAPYFTMRRLLRGRERLRRALRWPTLALCLVAGAALLIFYVHGLRAASEHMLKAARENRIVLTVSRGVVSYGVVVSETVGGEERPLVEIYSARDLADLQVIFARAREAEALKALEALGRLFDEAPGARLPGGKERATERRVGELYSPRERLNAKGQIRQ